MLALILGGIALAVLPFPNPFAIVAGGLLTAIGLTSIPRFPRVPKGVVARDRFPATYALADRVADELCARHVDAIVITGDYNAYCMRGGVRGRRVLGLGLPLLVALNGQERAAVIAHEVAHDVNGDPMRGRYIEGAYRALAEMHGLLAPNQWRHANRSGGVRGAEMAASAAMANMFARERASTRRTADGPADPCHRVARRDARPAHGDGRGAGGR